MLALFLAFVMTTGMVPTQAIAEALDEAGLATQDAASQDDAAQIAAESVDQNSLWGVSL